VVDDYNLELLAIEVVLNLPSIGIALVLEHVLAWIDHPVKIRMHNGLEYISITSIDWAKKH
jgi:putative transposase